MGFGVMYNIQPLARVNFIVHHSKNLCHGFILEHTTTAVHLTVHAKLGWTPLLHIHEALNYSFKGVQQNILIF